MINTLTRLSSKVINIIVSFVLTMLIVGAGYGMMLLWNVYHDSDKYITKASVTAGKVREWSTLIEWSVTINSTIMSSNLPPETVGYFIGLNKPVIDRISTIRSELDTSSMSSDAIALLDQIDATREQWLLVVREGIILKTGPKQENHEMLSNDHKVRLVRLGQSYINTLTEFRNSIENDQSSVVRSIISRLAILLMSAAMIGFVVVALVARKALESNDEC